MAVTVAQIAAAIRVGDTTEETAEVTRLKMTAEALLSDYAGAPDALMDEGVIRVCAYLFDMPNAGRGASYANIVRNSGAGRLLVKYRVVRARSTAAEAEAE